MIGKDRIGEDRLAAWIDGELDAGEAQAVARAVEADPELLRRADAHRRLRSMVARTYPPVIQDAAADPLAALIASSGPPACSTGETPETRPETRAELVDLASVRAAREKVRAPEVARPQVRSWAPWAMAAGVVVAALLLVRPTSFAPPQGAGADSASLFAEGASGMTAKGPLEHSLSHDLASAPDNAAVVRVGLSFRDQSGAWCRTFAASRVHMAGLACRNAGAWRIQVLESAGAGDHPGQFRSAASSISPAVQAAVEARLNGEAADAGQERVARDSGWR